MAAELAQALHTPLPAILAMAVDEILFWHGEACLIAEERIRR